MKLLTKNRLEVHRSRLLQQDLLDLLEGEILVLRIYPFVTLDLSQQWVQKVKHHPMFERYSMAPDVGVRRIGMTLFEAQNEADKLEAYYRLAAKTYQTMDELFAPLVNPLKRLHRRIHNNWSAGTKIESVEGRAMNPGILRQFETAASGGLPPHQDVLQRDLPDCRSARQLRGQLAANLYLELPRQGGELEVWDFAPSSREVEMLYTGHHDFIQREQLPFEAIRIKPRPAELILFRSDCVHAVRASKESERTAVSCFVGYYGVDKPLTFWS